MLKVFEIAQRQVFCENNGNLKDQNHQEEKIEDTPAYRGTGFDQEQRH